MTIPQSLGKAESQRGHDAVAACERRTSARFAIVVVPASDHYALYPVVAAAVAALAATGLLAIAFPSLGLPLGFLAEAVLFLALAGLFHVWKLRLLLVPRHATHQAASRLAHREFAIRIVAHGSERTGILLFVSLGERYVEILADRDIHAKVDEGTWDAIVAAFVASMQQGHTIDGIVAAAESCGTILATHFPRATQP